MYETLGPFFTFVGNDKKTFGRKKETIKKRPSETNKKLKNRNVKKTPPTFHKSTKLHALRIWHQK